MKKCLACTALFLVLAAVVSPILAGCSYKYKVIIDDFWATDDVVYIPKDLVPTAINYEVTETNAWVHIEFGLKTVATLSKHGKSQ